HSTSLPSAPSASELRVIDANPDQSDRPNATAEEARVNLLDLAPDAALVALEVFMREENEAGYRAGQVFARLWDRPVNSFDDITELPKSLRQRLAARFHLPRLALQERQRSTDGTEKFLFRL